MAELMELFLTGPAPFANQAKESSGSTFATEFVKFVETNSMLKPALNSNFFTMFFLSSLLTLPHSKLLERHMIENVYLKIEENNLIKLVYPRVVGHRVVMESRVALFGEHALISTEYANGRGLFNMNEIKEIADLCRVEIDVFDKLEFQYRIFQVTRTATAWLQGRADFLKKSFETVLWTTHSTLVPETSFVKLSTEKSDSGSLLTNAFSMLDGARTPEQTKEASMYLMRNLKLLFDMVSKFIPDRFQRSSELFSAFASGTIIMNLKNRYHQWAFIHQPTTHMRLLSLVPNAEKSLKLSTPVSLVFVNSHEEFTATMQLVNSPQRDLIFISPLTNSKLAALAVSNFNNPRVEDSVAATLFTVNQPLLSKLMLDTNELIDYPETLLFDEVNDICHRLNSRDIGIVSNYVLGQMLASQHRSINGRYVFTYNSRQLKENVRTYVITTDSHVLAINFFKEKNLIHKSRSLWKSDFMKLVPVDEEGKDMVRPSTWKNGMIKLNIDISTGQVRISKSKNGGYGFKRLTGSLTKFQQLGSDHFIQTAGGSAGNDEFSKYVAPLHEHLTSSSELMAFFMGLFSEQYSCLPSTGPGGEQMLSLFDIDSKTIVDQESIMSELKNYHSRIPESTELSPLLEVDIRINIFSSIYYSDLSTRRTVPAMTIDVTMQKKFSPTSGLAVELRKSYHNAPEEQMASDAEWLEALPDECAMQGMRPKRSWMSECSFGEDVPTESKEPSEEKKIFGLLTENRVKLFQHVINGHQYDFWTYMQKVGMIQKLHNIYTISNAVSMGIIYKNIASDLYRGDYAGAATGAAFLGGNYLISKGSSFLSQKKYFQNSKTLGFISPVLRRSAPFLKRFAAGYNLYSLYTSASSYSKNRDTMSLVDTVQSSTFLVVDVTEIAMEAFELEALLSIVGPIGAVTTAIIFLAAEIYRIHEILKPYEQTLHLSSADKVLDGIYTFFTGEVDSAIKDMADEKIINEKLAVKASKYLLDHKDILIYILPIYISIDGRQRIADDNVINLSQKQNIKWPQVLPDAHKMDAGTGILCFTSEEAEWSDHVEHASSFEKIRHYWNSFWESSADLFRTRHPSYRCENALGLLNKNATKGKILIDLQDGDDFVAGSDNKEHIFIIGNGRKTILSRSSDLSTYLFTGNLTTGSIFNAGSGIADFANYAQNVSQPVVTKMYGRTAVIQTNEDVQLVLENVSSMVSRKDKPDHMSASCFLSSFNGNGAGKKDVDKLVIPDKLCFYNLSIRGSDSIEIDNQATIGSFKYFLDLDAGSALINTTNSSLAEHEVFFLHWNMIDLDELYRENGCIFFRYWTAYSEICNGNLQKFTFRFADGFSLIVSKDATMHAFGAVRNSSDSHIRTLYDFSQGLEVVLSVKCLDTNTSILISHRSSSRMGKHVPIVLPNDHNVKRNFLIGGADENIFVISPVVNSTVTNIIISILNEDSTHNAVDLTSFDGKNISYTVEKSADDLILTILSRKNQVETGGSHITTSMKINKCFKDDLYKKFTVVLKNPMFIEFTTDHQITLIPRPITIDPSENPVTIIEKDYIEPELQIYINRTVAAWSIYRTHRNLIWLAQGSRMNIFWIIFNGFYTIDDESRIDIKITFDENDVRLLWNNTRPGQVQTLKSMMQTIR